MKKIIPIIIFLLTIGLNSYAQTVDLQKGLVAYYPFNGNANDESGNGNDGVIYGGASFSYDRFNRNNCCLKLDGINDYVKGQTSNFPLQKNDRTISLWFKLNEVANNFDFPFCYGQPKPKQTYGILFSKDKTGKYNIGVFGWAYDFHKEIQNPIGNWSHLVITYQNNKTEIYLNGLYISSINMPYLSTSSGYFVIGSNMLQTWKQYLNGYIDDVYIYDRAINIQEIKALYEYTPDNIPPKITITTPNVTRGFKAIIEKSQVTITGKAIDASGIFEILINNEPASVDAQGNFSKTVLLAFGDNSFIVKATDIKQNTAIETFTIERKSNQQDVVVVNNQTSNSNNLQTGKYYALIIGNNDYQDPAITSLDEPINDATKLYNVLTTDYTFEPQNVTFLRNASYVEMIDAFDNLSNKITENDNLLVFYAGHGWWDDDKELGYWLPTDAKQKSTAFWIANSRISDYMSSIDTKHTLLIADACFSGSIFKTRSAFADAGQAINSLYELPSRTAMTSGNLKEVPDKSVFLEYLVKRLDNNTEKYLSADQLFVNFRIAVMNNSQTEPQFGTIQNAGDEGGEFIFIRRD